MPYRKRIFSVSGNPAGPWTGSIFSGRNAVWWQRKARTGWTGMECIFVSDLHGKQCRYEKLAGWIARHPPRAVFLGGDLLPPAFLPEGTAQYPEGEFIAGFLARTLDSLRRQPGANYPRVFLILGNDDARSAEPEIRQLETEGLLTYAHNGRFELDGWSIFGYSMVPPTPFFLKDWEQYDVSRYTDPGCIPPDEGLRSVPRPLHEIRHRTIAKDLAELAGAEELPPSIFLFHAPPYQTMLDRAALDGKMVDYAPLDVHVGSIAIRRFIEERHPAITLHGHIHESARLTGQWQDRIGKTHCFTAAHDGPELALITFDPEDPAGAQRHLI